MRSYTFQLVDTRTRRQARTVLMAESETHARKMAAIHLSGSPCFSAVRILLDKRVLCTVDRQVLDVLGRPMA